MIRVEMLTNADALAARAADVVADLARTALTERGLFACAVSGGSTPAGMLARLAAVELPWQRVHVFQVDERVAPAGHVDRNFGGLQANLLQHVPMPATNVHPMPVEAADLDAAARAYAGELHTVCDGVLDLVHLGLGDDGHTASWPPGDPVADTTDSDVAVVGPYRGRVRMTLTPLAVNRARRILWLVSGASKAAMLERLLAGDPALPATRVRSDRAVMLAAVRP